MKNIETEKITVLEKSETDEATKLLEKQKEKINVFNVLYGVAICLTAIIFIYIYNSANKTHVETLIAGAFIMLLISIVWYLHITIKLKDYKKLLKLAKANDKLRHEERIRYRERKRLEEEEPIIKAKQTPTSAILPKRPPKENN